MTIALIIMLGIMLIFAPLFGGWLAQRDTPDRPADERRVTAWWDF